MTSFNRRLHPHWIQIRSGGPEYQVASGILRSAQALRIAQSEGAETYASESYRHAVTLMDNTDKLATNEHADKKQLIAVAREVVQTAEDARAIAIKEIDGERLANERRPPLMHRNKRERKPTPRHDKRSKHSLTKLEPKTQRPGGRVSNGKGSGRSRQSAIGLRKLDPIWRTVRLRQPMHSRRPRLTRISLV